MACSEQKKGLLNMISGILGQVIALITGIIIPRLVLVNYGSEMNGFLNSIVQIFSYMSLLEAGVGGSTLQALYEPVANKNHKNINGILSATAKYYNKTAKYYFILLILSAIIYSFFVNSSISKITIINVILFTGVNGAVGFLSSNKFNVLLRAEGKNYIIANATTFFLMIGSVTKVFLLYRCCNIILVQGVYGIILCFPTVYLYYYRKKKYKWINYNEKPDFNSISQKNSVLVQQITTLIFNNTDVLLLSFMGQSLKVVSIYTMYNLILTMVKNMMNQIVNGFSFKLGQLYQIDKKKYIKFHHLFECLNLIIVFSSMTVVYYCLLPFIKLYTKGVNDTNYIDEKLLLLFIVIQLLDMGRLSSLNAINFAGHFKKTQSRCIIEVCINMGFSIIGIHFWGIYGVLLGTVCALIYRVNDMILYSYKYLLHQNPLKTYRRWVLCVLGFIINIIVCSPKFFIGSSYFDLIIYGMGIGVVSIIIYSFILFVAEYKSIIIFIKANM